MIISVCGALLDLRGRREHSGTTRPAKAEAQVEWTGATGTHHFTIQVRQSAAMLESTKSVGTQFRWPQQPGETPRAGRTATVMRELRVSATIYPAANSHQRVHHPMLPAGVIGEPRHALIDGLSGRSIRRGQQLSGLASQMEAMPVYSAARGIDGLGPTCHRAEHPTKILDQFTPGRGVESQPLKHRRNVARCAASRAASDLSRGKK
jgi:hypothetical protein